MRKATEGREAADKYRQTQIDELLRLGTVKDGWAALWLEMQQKAEQPGEILFKGMMSAVDGVSKNLADLGSGKKGNWGKTFEDIGRQMQEATIKSVLHQGLGALARRFHPGDVGRDGQSRNKAIFVDTGGTTAPGGSGASPGSAAPGAKPGIGIFGGSSPSNPFILHFGSADSAYPGTAAGGILRQRSGGAGSLSPTGPSAVTYYITVDARGADENAIYQRVAQGVMAAQKAAVNQSVQISYDRQQRTPQ